MLWISREFFLSHAKKDWLRIYSGNTKSGVMGLKIMGAQLEHRGYSSFIQLLYPSCSLRAAGKWGGTIIIIMCIDELKSPVDKTYYEQVWDTAGNMIYSLTKTVQNVVEKRGNNTNTTENKKVY